MPYTGANQKVAEHNKFSFSFDKEGNFNEVDVKKGTDRFRRGYHEVCLKSYDWRTVWDLAVSLEENGYRLVDAEETGLTYYSPDGKTEIYLDDVSNAGDEMRRIIILRGELTKGELPQAEQEVKALLCALC